MIVNNRTQMSAIEQQLQLEQAKTLADRAGQGDDKKLKETCQQFEAMFIKIMLNSMRNTVQKSEMIDGGMAEDIFEDMLYDEYADKLSQAGNFGIGEMMYNQLNPSSQIILR